MWITISIIKILKAKIHLSSVGTFIYNTTTILNIFWICLERESVILNFLFTLKTMSMAVFCHYVTISNIDPHLGCKCRNTTTNQCSCIYLRESQYSLGRDRQKRPKWATSFAKITDKLKFPPQIIEIITDPSSWKHGIHFGKINTAINCFSVLKKKHTQTLVIFQQKFKTQRSLLRLIKYT